VTKRAGGESDRREQILDAAARVLSEQGVRAFTHRSVAKEAGVPLGLTTYYFKDRDELLLLAIRKARVASQTENARVIRELIDQLGLAAGLARYIEYETKDRLAGLTRNYRVYVTALYQPSLQSEISSWHPGPEFAFHTDPATAASLGYLVEGYLIHAVINNRSFLAEEVLPAIQRLLGEEQVAEVRDSRL